MTRVKVFLICYNTHPPRGDVLFLEMVVEPHCHTRADHWAINSEVGQLG